ncbi:hypothetical protein Z949_2688 [Sulfitobacter guttiformis KCTC 32187]|nr:hypothetical protein Z949_2688 [Sulfitobacter guttiformis KCTC 32187]
MRTQFKSRGSNPRPDRPDLRRDALASHEEKFFIRGNTYLFGYAQRVSSKTA